MFWTNFKRIARAGFYNFWRNGTVTLASVLVMTVTLTVIGFIFFANAILDTTLAELKNRIDVDVTFVTSAAEEDILSVKNTLESLPEVQLVLYVSREEVLENFRERHASDQTILAALEEVGDNPFGAILNIKTSDPSQYASVAEFLESGNALSSAGLSIIDSINYFKNQEAIDSLTNIIASADRLGFALAIFFSVVSVLIAFNTIRLAIYLAKDEIGVMRLVGASTSYIRGPFVVLGVIYGLTAAVLTLLLFLPITYWLSGATASFFSGFNIYSYYLRHSLDLAGLVALSGVLIGSISSGLAIRKYLKI